MGQGERAGPAYEVASMPYVPDLKFVEILPLQMLKRLPHIITQPLYVTRSKCHLAISPKFDCHREQNAIASSSNPSFKSS